MMSSFLSTMKRWPITQAMLCIVFLVSGLLVNLLQFCSLILWPISRDWYRRINTRLMYLSFSQLVFLAEHWSGSNCLLRTSAKDLPYFGNEPAICIMNHSYEIDWLMSWILCDRCGVLGSSKVFLKKILRWVPVIGWCWTFGECIFLERSWDKDKQVILRQMANLCDYPEHIWVLIFCEGTRFTKAKHEESVKFAESRGLPVLKHLLMPRTRGFILTIQGFKHRIPAIYDCTVAFRPGSATPTMKNILCGERVEAELLVNRIPMSEVPADDEQELANWLYTRYKKKDDELSLFESEGGFIHHPLHDLPQRPHSLLVFTFWAVLILTPFAYWVVSLILTGSIIVKALILLILIAVLIGLNKMIGFTEVQKGSQYGKTSVSKNNGAAATCNNNTPMRHHATTPSSPPTLVHGNGTENDKKIN